jgi:energy-coupling factor transporter transmembrane protein EcfT
LYLIAALVLPGLPFFVLPILLLAALAVGWRRGLFTLIWRTRWLLLVMVLGYAYSLPGPAALAGLGDYSPSIPGLGHGALQALRLLVLLAWLDVLVLRLPASELMGALRTMFLPLRHLGLDPDRLALRLGLTLSAIEGLERGRGNLARLFAADAGQTLPDRVVVAAHPLAVQDRILGGVILLAGVGLWLSV